MLFLSPGRNANISKLRNGYISCLKAYTGTKYVWGGENKIGIDCSGLVRSGLIVVNYREGLVTLNPKLMREGISLWWNDCSAKDLGETYPKTRFLFSASSINALDITKILPGDMAVTSNGVHVLAYIGDQTWIEADPIVGKVIQVMAPTDNPWFHEPVNLVRWKQLEK